jgi:hypothetical protein
MLPAARLSVKMVTWDGDPAVTNFRVGKAICGTRLVNFIRAGMRAITPP